MPTHSNTKLDAAPSTDAFRLDEQGLLPILITGVSGVSGYNLFHELRSKYGDAVIGTRPEKTYRMTGEGIIGTNLSEPDNIRRLIDEHEIRTVINCGGSCHLKGCELDHAMARRVNVQAVENLLDAIKERPVRLIHLSIDLVFGGAGDGDHVESDAPDPVTMYGRTMVMAEQAVQHHQPDAAILRISLPMGVSFNGHAGAIDWIQHRFAKNLPATLYFDEIRTPTYCQCLNAAIVEVACRREMNGIYHAGGPTKLSLYQIAQIVNRVGGYDPALLNGCPRIDAGPVPPRAGNVTLNSNKLREALGRQPFLPWPLIESQLPTDRDWHHVRDSSIAGTPELIKTALYVIPQTSSLGPPV